VPPAGERVDPRPVTNGPIVFCVQSDDVASGQVDARAALGLGDALTRRGCSAVVLDRERWRQLPADAAILVSLSPAFDPALVPLGTPVVAWMCDQIGAWTALTQLPYYDAVLTSSAAEADRIAEVFAGLVRVFPIGVDTTLFRPHRVRRPSRTVVNLSEVRHHSYFTLPDLYRDALAVVDDVGSANPPFGTRISRLFESVVCGAIPVTSHSDELGEIRLNEMPVCNSVQEIDRVVSELQADPVRASAFLTLVEPLTAELEGSLPAVPSATLGYFPDYRGNPYQAMLYAELAAHGVTVTPVDATNSLVPRDPGGSLDHYVLHVHWTAPLLQSQPGPFSAELALRRFRQRFSEFRKRGGRLVWTIHNVLPHECPNTAAEIELCRLLAAHADLIHVMGADTADIVAPLYELAADRTVVIPHSSYVGVYPDVVSRTEARSQLQLHEHEIVLLMLGAIRRYKGLDLLLEVFDELSRSDPRLRLLVVGKPANDPICAHWRERCEQHPRIVAHFARAADADLQIWCRAADLAVLPYVSILNSGWFQLALSFDLPVVGARDGSLAALMDPAYSEPFTPGSAVELKRALKTAIRRLVERPEVRRAAHLAASKYSPTAMARDFADAILPLFKARSPNDES
jgi:glycosyltransferase involved in cell wall biosynthesis